MDIESVRDYCMAKPAVTEGFPFDAETLVFKVGGKMFALLSLEGDHMISLKCDPELAISLREQYPEVVPGYHMNKVHWNSVYVAGSLPDHLIKQWIDHSYSLVIASLPVKLRKSLGQ